MTGEYLKLTAYFGERQRSGGRFLSDAMVDLYEQRDIAASAVLRGIGGFGSHHQLRSDRSLSLSEDPPVAVVAVDTEAAIRALLDPVRVMAERALITVERARLCAGDARELTEHLHETTKLTIYLGRKERIRGAPAYLAVCELLHRGGLDGASVLLGVDGTAYGLRQRARFFGGNADVPVMILAVGRADRIAGVLPQLDGLLRRRLVTVERVRVCKRDGELLESPQAPAECDLALRQKLTVYTCEDDRHRGVPVHRALIQRLRQHRSLSGATALRGIWGFHGDRGPRGDRLFALTRRVPVVTVIIDAPQRVAESFAVVDELTGDRGLVTSEMVSDPVAVGDDGTAPAGCAEGPDWG